MKIISKFRDCYDSVLAIGREESIVYVRHTTEIDINENFNYLDKLYRDVPNSHVQYKDKGCYYQSTFDPIFFFICGKIYIVYRYVDDHKNLNDLLTFQPTAENLAKYLHKQLKKQVNKGSKIIIEIWEAEKSSIVYYED